MDRVELKTAAKEQIKGNIGILFVISLIIAAISGLPNIIPMVGGLATIFITPAFALSSTLIYLNLTQYQKPEVGDAFKGFNDFWSAFKVQFLSGLFICLWSLLFVIPGIVKTYSYSMAIYILAENPGMPALEAINRSKEMMDGHKMDLFVLGLSFILWILLVMVTFGIAAIWVGPYINATTANFYNKIKGESMSAEPVAEIEE